MDDMDDRRETDRERQLPEFEKDDERTVGGGLMSSGGTVTDRGTGDLDSVAPEDADADEADDTDGDATGPDARDARDRLIPAAGAGAGGAPYLAAALLGDSVDDEDKRDDEGRATD
jgi:hypothetical protein